MRHAIAVIATLLLALTCGTASAQWKWRDAAGRINASDLPPPSTVPDRDVLERPTDPRLRPNPSRAAPAASATLGAAGASAPSGVDPELEARRKRAANEQSTQQRQQQEREAAVRAENCSRARANVGALSDGGRIVRANAQGEREFLDDKAIAEELQRARSIVATECR